LDLSFARSSPFAGASITALPTELAVLLAGVVARQAACPTARAQARLAFAGVARVVVDRPLAPVSGAFSALTAAALRRWQGG
jgi:hypothetical protein